MIKCCIFDLDGTLLYTLGTITHYVNLTLGRYGIEGISEEECRLFIGDGARNLILRSLRSKGIEDTELAERILKDYNEAYNKDTSYLTRPYDGIPEMLKALGERGIRLGVLSNKPDETTRIVIDAIFPAVFDIVRGGRDSIPLKPMPDGLSMIAEELSLSPSEIMYIGDTGVDIKTGLAYGAALTVGVAWGYRDTEELKNTGADIIVASPLEIVKEVMSRA